MVVEINYKCKVTSINSSLDLRYYFEEIVCGYGVPIMINRCQIFFDLGISTLNQEVLRSNHIHECLPTISRQTKTTHRQ